VNIYLNTKNGEKKNLVYIYLESMETTYASTDVGGFQDVNFIPNLTNLAFQNISF
jgi:phosphoglycerol transferase